MWNWGYMSGTREGGALHVTKLLLHGAFKDATFQHCRPSRAQRLKSRNRWQLGGGFNNRRAGLRIHSYSFIYLFCIFLQPTANYNSNFRLEFKISANVPLYLCLPANWYSWEPGMSHFWGMCRHLFINIRGVHTYTCPQHSVSVHQTHSRIHPDHMGTALTFRNVLGGGSKNSSHH